MKTRIIAGAAMVALLSACGSKTSAPVESDYTLSFNFGNDNANGKMAYVINFDTNDKIDSTVVEGGVANFTGKIVSPTVVAISADGRRSVGRLILEEGENTFIDGKGQGSLDKAYYEANARIEKEEENLASSLDSTLTDVQRKEAISALIAKRDSF
ncbi:MAG: DUF4369 domain-containing protein, partial [Muribaculaceae bacterium]|nr:DUF4369 domain-containing protein [Muribaculaceae bacterium]